MTVKKCILCGYKIDVSWGHTDLFKHEEAHTPTRFLGWAEQEDETTHSLGACSICGGIDGDHDDDCDYG